MSNSSPRSILILGCGALGGALVDRLNPHVDVTVLDPSPRARVKMKVFHRIDEVKSQTFDGLIVATKSYDVEKSLIPFKNRVFVDRILFLQNGILDLNRIKRIFPKAAMVRGVTTSAVGIKSGKSVFHYQGDFFLASEDDSKNKAVAWFAHLLTETGLETKMVLKSSSIVWAKLIFSAVMNPLPVMTGKGYDILKKDQKVWKLVQQAVDEGRTVAKILGIRLAFDPLLLIRRVRNGDLSGIPHRGSIVQDLSVRHQTELNFITGALIRQARQAGVETPALKTILFKARLAGA